MSAPVFKEYDPSQATFLPPSLDELIDTTHMVRFVDHVIDQMDLDPILATYPGGGASSYHPRMMLKVLIYSYVERIHSCRNIAKAVAERIPFMWLAAGYNLQMGAQNQYYSIHANAADKVNLAGHLEDLSFTPQWVCADAGYGSLYNYELLAEAGITGVIKHPDSYRNPASYSRYAMEYEPERDQYQCPQGQAMPLKETKDYCYGPRRQRTAQTHVYECVACSGCPVKSDCTYGEGNRSIQFTRTLEDWKQTMSERMSRGKGKTMSRNRGMAIESVFGLLKQNDGMRRLLMRSKKMATVEVGLKSLAHNLRKMRSDILDGLMRHLMIAMSLQATCQTA